MEIRWYLMPGEGLVLWVRDRGGREFVVTQRQRIGLVRAGYVSVVPLVGRFKERTVTFDIVTDPEWEDEPVEQVTMTGLVTNDVQVMEAFDEMVDAAEANTYRGDDRFEGQLDSFAGMEGEVVVVGGGERERGSGRDSGARV